VSEDQAVSAPAVDVAAIRAALSNATPGPWQREGESDWASNGGELWFGEAGTRADAELIVLLRNNAEALLDEVERRRARPVDLDGWKRQAIDIDAILAGIPEDDPGEDPWGGANLEPYERGEVSP
jgi:hypothetical protein